MIYLFVPVYPEAAYLIEALNLKRVALFGHIQTYENSEQSCLLTLTGAGKNAVCAAVASVLAIRKPSDASAAVLFGSAAGLKDDEGQLYQLNKITDIDTGRSYYPDMVINTGLRESAGLTGSLLYGITGRRDIPAPYDPAVYLKEHTELRDEYELYDTESAGFYETAACFFAPERIIVLRFISDRGERITADQLKTVAGDRAAEALPLLKRLTDVKGETRDIDETARNDLSKAFRASAAMRVRLFQCLDYCDLAGIDWHDLKKKWETEGRLPAKDKEDGKEKLRAFTDILLQ